MKAREFSLSARRRGAVRRFLRSDETPINADERLFVER